MELNHLPIVSSGIGIDIFLLPIRYFSYINIKSMLLFVLFFLVLSEVPYSDARSDQHQTLPSFYSIQLRNGSTMSMPKSSWTTELLKISEDIPEALEIVTRVVNENPYPNDCNLLYEGTLSNFEICLDIKHWNEQFPQNSYNRRNNYGDILSIDRLLALSSFEVQEYVNINRTIIKANSDKSDHDCIYHTRKFVKPTPGDCYGDFGKWEKEKHLHTFISEIFNDWRYTYDYVLYDELFPQAKENRMWYLIAYLRQLVKHFGNPHALRQALFAYHEGYKERALAMKRDLGAVKKKIEVTLETICKALATAASAGY